MIYHRFKPLFALAVILAAVNACGFDQSITGSAKTKLSGPMTEEQTAKCKLDAKYKLKSELLQWVEEQKAIKIDTTDLVANLLFDGYVDSCAKRAKAASAFKENYWTFSYSLAPEEAQTAMTAYNDRIELLAVHSWKRLENAMTQKNDEEIYYQSVEVLANATAYIGPPLAVPSDSAKTLVEEGRGILKHFLERLSITTTGYIIEGKPGHQPAVQPRMCVKIDGKPFAGLGFIGYIPGGMDLFTGVADNTGNISFDNFIIPFIKNGVMMYVSPNLGRVVNSKWRIGINDFGLKLKKDLNQTFFFKITKPSFALQYEATSTDPTQPLPSDIASGVLVKRYLTDSCWLQPVSGSASADLIIAIKCEVASGGAGDEERGGARLKGNVVIQAPGLMPPRTETESINYEKKYEKALIEITKETRKYRFWKTRETLYQVPIGTFLWDSNLAINGAIRKILNRL